MSLVSSQGGETAAASPYSAGILNLVPRASAGTLQSPEATCPGETGEALTQTEAGGATRSPTLPSSRQRHLPWSRGKLFPSFRGSSCHSSRLTSAAALPVT